MSIHCQICGKLLEDEDGQIYGVETGNGHYTCPDPLDCCDCLLGQLEMENANQKRLSDLVSEYDAEVAEWQDMVKDFCSEQGTSPISIVGAFTTDAARVMLEQVFHEIRQNSALGVTTLTVTSVENLETIMREAIRAELERAPSTES